MALVEFKINDVTHRLFFGTQATEIIKTRSANSFNNNEAMDNFKAFAVIVFAGVSNYLSKEDKPVKSWSECWDLTEAIVNSKDVDLQDNIYKTWAESQAGADMLKILDNLNGNVKKKAEAKKVQDAIENKEAKAKAKKKLMKSMQKK